MKISLTSWKLSRQEVEINEFWRNEEADTMKINKTNKCSSCTFANIVVGGFVALVQGEILFFLEFIELRF